MNFDNGKDTVLYFGNEWGADNRTSSHHIASRLMRDYNFVYIESPGLRSPQLNRHDVFRIFKKLAQIFKKKRVIDTTTFVKTLYQVPFHNIPFIKYVNSAMVKWQVRKICRKNHITKPILWCVLPHVADVLDSVESKCCVYYIVDDFSEMPGVNKKYISVMDERLCKKSDVVFVTSEPLYKTKSCFGDKVHINKHGVDYEHFNKAINRDMPVPPQVANLKAPVIGFFGLIEEWIDLEVIKMMAVHHPDWNFLMIGRVAVDNSEFDNISNVSFIGSVSYEELPAYAQLFDVSLIPVVNNELIRNFNPLKLREYLAMGQPVVTAQFPELEEFSDYIYASDNHQQFESDVARAMDENTPEKRLARAKSVEGSSWENRYQNVNGILRSSINSKENR